jgi:aconitate hydratase
VKTSLAPGSQVVAAYLKRPVCRRPRCKLGFNLVGFGCTTCIGNSGPLDPPISKAINEGASSPPRAVGQPQLRRPDLPDVQANYLASPPLVVAYALAGTVNIDLTTEPIGRTRTATTST